MPSLRTIVLWISCTCLTPIVTAIPTIEHLVGWDDGMGSLVPGAAYVQAIGRGHTEDSPSRHLNVPIEGSPGNLTITNDRRPEWFYIRQQQLYQVINSTAIYSVNIKNITGTSDFPLQLVSSKKREGRRSGTWRWQGSLLFYEEGKMGNGGLYYECTLKDGLPGVFTFLKGVKPPDECSMMTLHGFNRLFVKDQTLL